MIFILSSIPGEEIVRFEIPHIDKIIHFFEYAVLGLLLIRAFLNSHLNLNLTKMMILAIVVASLYALSDELHQRFVLYRTCDFFDLLADFIGLNIGIFIYKQRSGSCQS